MHKKKNSGDSRPFSVRETVLKVLVKVGEDHSYVNLLLPSYLQGLYPPERALATKLAYGTIQRLNTLDWILKLFLKKPIDKLTPWIRNNLRCAVYQLIYLDHIPSSLVVDIAVRLAYRYGHRGVASLVNGVLRNVSRNQGGLPWPDFNKAPIDYLVLVHSHPRWLVERWVHRLGIKEAEAMCAANNQPKSITVRVNRTVASEVSAREALEEEGVKVEEVPSTPMALRIAPGRSLRELSSFQKGLCTVQGEASIWCGYVLAPSLDEEAVDICSAPGGKATHLGELMSGQGTVYAGDIKESRLGLVKKNAFRLGLNNITTCLWDGKEIHRYIHPVDRVLCDAPCSGLGVVSLKPDLKWGKSENHLLSLARLQKELLQASSNVVKSGGYLLYAVCSLEPEETEEVVKAFLQANPDFIQAFPLNESTSPPAAEIAPGEFAFYPHLHTQEGFYMALFFRR